MRAALQKYQPAGVWDGLLYPPGKRILTGAARRDKGPTDVSILTDYLLTNGPTVSTVIGAALGWDTARLRNTARTHKFRIVRKESAETTRLVQVAVCAVAPDAQRPTSKRSAATIQIYDALRGRSPMTYDELASATGIISSTIRNIANSRPSLFTLSRRTDTIMQVMKNCAVYDVSMP